MKIKKIDISDTLHFAFLQDKPAKESFDVFKQNFKRFLKNANENETEENLKNDLIQLFQTIYQPQYYINTKERADLVILNDQSPKSDVGVLFEIKHPNNKQQMIAGDNLNCKGFHQLILYFLSERINHKNINLKHLVLTNINDWYIFDAAQFNRLFFRNAELVRDFNEWQHGQKTAGDTETFYQNIAKRFIEKSEEQITATHFTLKEFAKSGDQHLVLLYKLFSPHHLLKLAFKNDSNSLNAPFYYELLHLLGLEEQTEGGIKYLKRKSVPDAASLLENAIHNIKQYNDLSEIDNINEYGETKDEQIFGVALELCILWLNRILFLKLLEAQLIHYHRSVDDFQFLTHRIIYDFKQLDNLFFDVLAIKPEDRKKVASRLFEKIPYLNSSLFEPTPIERKTFFIGSLDNSLCLTIYKSTVLKDERGDRSVGELPTLEYLLDFLDAYNFGSDVSDEFQNEDKTLINSSVLGLIFEKINGYKDGSFFTPGYITMYICRESIRRAVVEQFNKKFEWNCQYNSDLTHLFNQVSKLSLAEANAVVNSITICDPAVGSGHFLVSALNEMIAVKSELEILTDRKGKLLKNYAIKVVNDELEIKDFEGKQFAYTLGREHQPAPELQCVQEAIFHEKQYLIENCLFGVDINQNSVNITRLRLWIELLKNAYYKAESNFTELQTLPNIDINIKCGNSLVHRFPLDTDLSKMLKSIKYDINYFKSCVQNYKHTENNELKKGYQKSIDQIKNDFKVQIHRLDPRQVRLNQLKEELQDRFLSPRLLNEEFSSEQKKKNREAQEKHLSLISQLEEEIEGELNGIVYRKAFEWRFEFPEILDGESGAFLGFDVVVGNPPYIDHKKLSLFSSFFSKRYQTYSSTGDISLYFFELGKDLLHSNGFLNYINTNKFFRTEYGKKCRDILSKSQIHYIVNFEQVPIFTEALVSSALVCVQKTPNKFDFPYAEFYKEPAPEKTIQQQVPIRNKYFNGKNLNSRAWSFSDDNILKIKTIIENQGRPIKDIESIEIFRGVTTGFDDAFIIKQDVYDELIAADEKNNAIIKPLLKGKDIKKFKHKFDNLWLLYVPWHFPLHGNDSVTGASLKAEKLLETDYKPLFKHLNSHKQGLSERNKAETGITYEWFALQRCAASYIDYFNKEKIIWPLTADKWGFALDTEAYFLSSGGFLLVSKEISLKYILAVLNSNLMRFYFSQIGVMTAGGAFTLKKATIERFPLIEISASEQQPFIVLVDRIIEAKNKDIDSSFLEAELDDLVYKLYHIKEAEINLIS